MLARRNKWIKNSIGNTVDQACQLLSCIEVPELTAAPSAPIHALLKTCMTPCSSLLLHLSQFVSKFFPAFAAKDVVSFVIDE
jgi:hypothetical protein